MKRQTNHGMEQKRVSRIGLCVGLVLLFCCLGFAPALASVLELPASLTQIADEAFMNDTSITSVVIPDGTTSIGARAFAYSGLTEIELPGSITYIADDAFEGCEDISFSFVNKDSFAVQWWIEHFASDYFTYNGHRYYFMHDSRQWLNIPEAYAQYDEIKCKAFRLGGHLAVINDKAENDFLVRCMKEKNISWAYIGYEDSIRETNLTGNYTWALTGTGESSNYTNWGSGEPNNSCEKFAQIDIGISGRWMDNDSGNDSQPKYYIIEWGSEECPTYSSWKAQIRHDDTPTYIDSTTQNVSGTIQNTEVNKVLAEMDDRYYILYDNKSKVCWVSKEAIAFTTDDDILYSLDGAEITIIGYTGNEQIITIPSTIDGYPVTAIGEKAFEDENIAGIYIPATVKEIGSNAFAFCSLDGALVIPDSVTYIGSGAFHDCYNLDSLTLSEGMTSIESDTFAASGFSGNLYIPEGITNIQENAFKYCNNLQAVYISPNVTEIGIDAFPSSITIYGVSGSYAETYAAENGIAFSTAPFPGTETEPDEETVTLSGSVTLADGTPVEDAYIYVYDTIAEDWIGLEYTDRNGAWACSVPADGSYTVHYLHDVYTIEPAEVSVSPAADMTLDTAIASLVGGEGMATPVFAMQMNGAEIPAAGVKVGDVVTFSITAEGATKVRLVADGVAYNEYWLTDGSATIERSFTHAGTRQIAFQAYDGSDWGAVCEAQTLIVTADGTLDAPVIHAIDTQYVGESFTVTWNAVENAESYTVYLYRNELLWPALSNTDRSTTTGLSMEIPGDLLYTDGEYLIEIIASGYGYSQSSSSVKFTVEETAAGVEITYPTDGMTYSVGDTMHTRYAMGSGTQGVRLLVAPPVGEPVLYAPDESGIFYPIADQVGDYVLTPYYSTSEGDFTAETADGAGESVTVTVQKPAISSLTQGTNKQYSIRYTGTAQDFAGSVSNVRYTVKVYLNDALVQEITPEDGEFAFTTDTLTETGKYVYAFVPCYGDIEGEPKEFPVYMVEQETESVTKYAGEPMLLLGAPDGSVKASLAYGAEVTILGTYSEEYLYVSANGKDGFIAAGSRLVEALEPSEMDINVECLTDVPYTKLGENRQYKITVNGAKAVYAKVRKPGTNADTYEAETGTDGFTVTIPAQNTGVYIATFHAVTMDDQEVHYTYSMPFLMVDASGTNVGKECWSNHSKMLPDAMSIYTQSDAEFDVTTCKMHVIGTINNDLVCVQRTMNDGSLKYAVVDASKIQYTKNKTVYRAVCVVNLYKLNTYKGDPCERTCENMIRCLQHIDNIQIWSAIAKDREGIDLKLSTVKALADYNDVTYIYWTGHGGEYNGESAHYWGILPIKDNGEHSSYGYGALCEYFALDLEDESDSLWEGKINAVFDSCFSGDFVTILENEYVNYPDFLYVPDTLSILMATEKGVRGAYAPEIGSLFPKALLEYVQSSTDEQLTLRRIKDNVISSYEENNKIIVSYSPSIWGDSNRIFFAEDPDAVN